MLQRIQTVFLLVLVLLMAVMLFFPIWVYQSEDTTVRYMLSPLFFESFGEEGSRVYFPYAIIGTLAIASATVGIIEITKFKNRLLQMKLGALNSLLMAATLGCAVYFATALKDNMALTYGWNYGPALFFPAIAMILNVLANRFIRRDERLVRSVDRIR